MLEKQPEYCQGESPGVGEGWAAAWCSLEVVIREAPGCFFNACLQRLPRTQDGGQEPVRDLDRDLSSVLFVLHACPVFT